jgi:hypothetical protein
MTRRVLAIGFARTYYQIGDIPPSCTGLESGRTDGTSVIFRRVPAYAAHDCSIKEEASWTKTEKRVGKLDGVTKNQSRLSDQIA